MSGSDKASHLGLVFNKGAPFSYIVLYVIILQVIKEKKVQNTMADEAIPPALAPKETNEYPL